MKKILLFISVFICSYSFGQRNKTEANVSGRFYYVNDYGAKHDSTTDDRAAIIRCFTAAKADSSAIVMFGDGRYRISDSIVVPTGLTIWGTSSGHNALPVNTLPVEKYPSGSVIIVTSSSQKGFVLSSPGGITNPGSIVRPVVIQGLSFWNTSGTTPTSTSAGIIVRDLMQFTLRDMQIQGFYINLNVISGDYWTADNCRFADAVLYQVSIGDDILPDAGDQHISQCLFETLFTRQPRAGIFYHGGGGLKISDCKFNKWDSDDNNRSTFGILLSMTDGVTSDFLLTNTSIENYDSSAIYILQNGSGVFFNVLISNTEMATSIAKSSPVKIIGGGSGDFGLVTFSNNTITDYGTTNNANAWITLTNTNYANLGTNTVRYYASPSITGGTNLGLVYDPIIGSLGINKKPAANIDITNKGANPSIVSVNNDQTAQYSNLILNNSGSKYISLASFGSGFGGTTAGITNANLGAILSVDDNFIIGTTNTTPLYLITNNVIRLTAGSTGQITLGTSEAHAYRAITALRTLDITDYMVNCTSNSFTVTLPTAVGITGRQYIIKNTGGATTITIATTSSQTIDGSAPGTITTLVPLRVMSDGANWITW